MNSGDSRPNLQGGQVGHCMAIEFGGGGLDFFNFKARKQRKVLAKNMKNTIYTSRFFSRRGARIAYAYERTWTGV